MADYQSAALDQEESDTFDAEWDRIVTRHFAARESVDIFEDHKAAIKETVTIAKYQLEARFGGQNARTNEFGWGPILPNHLLATTTPTFATRTWNKDITTANVTTGWVDWIGSSSSNLKVSKYNTMIIIGFADPVDEPKINGVLAKVKGYDYPIWNFGQAMQETDNHVFELATPLVVEKEQDLYIQKLCSQAGRDKLQPIGIMFAKGDNMRNKSAYAQT